MAMIPHMCHQLQGGQLTSDALQGPDSFAFQVSTNVSQSILFLNCVADCLEVDQI